VEVRCDRWRCSVFSLAGCQCETSLPPLSQSGSVTSLVGYLLTQLVSSSVTLEYDRGRSHKDHVDCWCSVDLFPFLGMFSFATGTEKNKALVMNLPKCYISSFSKTITGVVCMCVYKICIYKYTYYAYITVVMISIFNG
jgi:hypothetical protein